MSIEKQITFAYLSSERMFPVYKYFSDNYSFGDSNIVRQAINFVHDNIFNKNIINIQQINYFLTAIDRAVPHTNDFDTFYATLAVDSGGVVYESVNLLKKNDINRILDDISIMPINALDCYIQMRDDMDYNDSDFENKIRNDELMQTEIHVQMGIIDYLDKIKNFDESDVNTLIELQGNNRPAILL